MDFNCAPRNVSHGFIYWFSWLVLGREYVKQKYCSENHGLGYMAGYSPENGNYVCPECGETDLDGLKVDYDKHPWSSFNIKLGLF
jgi:hypothetical protein